MIQASQWQQLSQLQAQMKANGAWPAANSSSTSSAPPIFTMPPLANWITSSHKGKGKGPKAPSATASSVASHAMSSVKLAKHQGTLPHMASSPQVVRRNCGQQGPCIATEFVTAFDELPDVVQLEKEEPLLDLVHFFCSALDELPAEISDQQCQLAC